MHLLFITTHNLPTNPRIVKEVQLAVEKGYDVTLVCFTFTNWSKNIHEEIKNSLKDKIQLIEIPGNRKPLLSWILSSAIFETARLALRIVPANPAFLSFASNKRSWLLMKTLRKLTGKYDWVIAHNIGSFYPALRSANRLEARLGIDLEDFHPGETNDPLSKKRITRLIKYILPKAAYITSASSPILQEYKKLAAFDCRQEVILNYFSKEEFVTPSVIESATFQLVWFSQNISYDRGLESIIPLVDGREDVELHLYGNCKTAFFNEWIKGRKNIFLHGAMPQAALHKELALYDAGLAIEPGRDQNNQLAVSNKLLAYYQAGLYIIASDTMAQKEFLKSSSHSGIVLNLQDENLPRRLGEIISSKDSIRSTKQARYYYAWSQNWESESEKLLKLWGKLGGDTLKAG